MKTMERAAKPVLADRRRARQAVPIVWIVFILSLWPAGASPVEVDQAPSTAAQDLSLTRAVLCEAIKEDAPHDAASVFSCGVGKMICYTSFEPCVQKTSVYHSWFRRDRLVSKQRIAINSAGWTASSSIQIRNADKGPWQVEISDSGGRILRVLRFSVVD